MKLKLVSKLSIFGLVAVIKAKAGWVQWSTSVGGNDHWYNFIDTGSTLNWTDANTLAAAQGAYLATLTSSAENNFAYSLITSWSNVTPYPNGWGGPWLGGFAPDNRPFPAIGWQWVTGETWSFTDWTSSQFNTDPNNSGGHENYLMIANLNDGLSVNVVGTWNDLSNAGTGGYFTTSYLLERDSSPVSDSGNISSWFSVALGLIFTAWIKLKSRRMAF